MLDQLLNAAGALPDREWGHRFGCPPAGSAARLKAATSKTRLASPGTAKTSATRSPKASCCG